jgi:hypothetical protein
VADSLQGFLGSRYTINIRFHRIDINVIYCLPTSNHKSEVQKYRWVEDYKERTRNYTTSRTHLSSLTSTTISFTSSEEGRRRSLRKPQTTFQRHLKPQPLSFPCGGTLPDSANAHPLRTLPQGKSERRKRKKHKTASIFF